MVTKRFISHLLDGERLVWFEASNRYVQMAEPAFEVFTKLYKGNDNRDVANWCTRKYGLEFNESLRFVKEIQQSILANNTSIVSKKEEKITNIDIPENYSDKYYTFLETGFRFQCNTEWLETLIHPLLAHLQVRKSGVKYHLFQLFAIDEYIVLRVDNVVIGRWSKNELHKVSGKVFFEIINKAYKKTENDWMALMHGSALSDGQNCIVLTGDSGSGKSTTLSLLLANGFDFLCDDFVPILANTGKVCQFPTAISVKKGAVGMLGKFYPNLSKTKEHAYPEQNKIVRYLSPNLNSNNPNVSFPVKALIFVNYSTHTELELNKIPKNKVLQNLVTESWISPEYKNVQYFFNWLEDIPFYSLDYSNNTKMISAIKGIFNDGQ